MCPDYGQFWTPATVITEERRSTCNGLCSYPISGNDCVGDVKWANTNAEIRKVRPRVAGMDSKNKQEPSVFPRPRKALAVIRGKFWG